MGPDAGKRFGVVHGKADSAMRDRRVATPWKTLASLLAFAAGILLAGGCGAQGQGAPATAVPKAAEEPPAAVGGAQPPGAAKGAAVRSENIIVAEPAVGADVTSPVRITGQARVYEGTVQVQVRDARGRVVGKGFTTALDAGPNWGAFFVELPFQATEDGEPGSVEVFSESARDGSVENLVAIPVVLRLGPGTGRPGQ
jgi:hypothetical protein